VKGCISEKAIYWSLPWEIEKIWIWCEGFLFVFIYEQGVEDIDGKDGTKQGYP